MISKSFIYRLAIAVSVFLIGEYLFLPINWLPFMFSLVLGGLIYSVNNTNDYYLNDYERGENGTTVVVGFISVFFLFASFWYTTGSLVYAFVYQLVTIKIGYELFKHKRF